jgi:formiminotetrahydrofolate cyclodeaminase
MSFADRTIREFLADLSARTPTPGGGATAAVCAALGAAQAEMVVAYSIGKKSLVRHEPVLREAQRVLENARAMFLRLADEDAEAYGEVNRLHGLPAEHPDRARLAEAVARSLLVPAMVLAAAADVLGRLATLPGMTNKALRSDLAIAALLVHAAAESSRWNIAACAAMMEDSGTAQRALAEADEVLARCGQWREAVAKGAAPEA